jgi:cation:H+ antiporter
MLCAMAVFSILARIEVQIGWVGLDSLLMMAMYLFGMWLIRSSPTVQSSAAQVPAEAHLPEGLPSLRHAVIGFGTAAAVLVLVTPRMVDGAVQIAEISGLTAGMVGMVMIAIVTSLPEVVTTVSAVRMGAHDLAIGNLFGSNVFNMFILGFIDLFYTEGRLFAAVSPTMTLAGMLGLMLTALAGMGNVARVERRVLFVEIDGFLILVLYVLGIWLLITRKLVG